MFQVHYFDMSLAYSQISSVHLTLGLTFCLLASDIHSSTCLGHLFSVTFGRVLVALIVLFLYLTIQNTIF